MTELFVALIILSFGMVGFIHLIRRSAVVVQLIAPLITGLAQGRYRPDQKIRSVSIFSSPVSKTAQWIKLGLSPAVYFGLVLLAIVLAILFSLLPAPTVVQAGTPAGYSEYYISGAAQQLWDIFEDIDIKRRSIRLHLPKRPGHLRC